MLFITERGRGQMEEKVGGKKLRHQNQEECVGLWLQECERKGQT